jgi:hypothetical protein
VITILAVLVGLVVAMATGLAGVLIGLGRADRRERRERRYQHLAARNRHGRLYVASGKGEPLALPEWTRRDAQFPINEPYGQRETM